MLTNAVYNPRMLLETHPIRIISLLSLDQTILSAVLYIHTYRSAQDKRNMSLPRHQYDWHWPHHHCQSMTA